MDECVTYSQTTIMTSPTLKPKNRVKNFLKMSQAEEIPDVAIENQELMVSVESKIDKEDVDISEVQNLIKQYIEENKNIDEGKFLELGKPVYVPPDPVLDHDTFREFAPGNFYNTETVEILCTHFQKASADNILVLGPDRFCEVWCWHERSHLKKPSAFEFMLRKINNIYSKQTRLIGVIYSDQLMKSNMTMNYYQQTAKKPDDTANSSQSVRKSSRVENRAQAGHFVSFDLDIPSGRCKVYDTILELSRANFEQSAYFNYDAFEILIGLMRDCFNSLRKVTQAPLLKIETAQLSRVQGLRQCGVLSLIYAEAMITMGDCDVSTLTYSEEDVNFIRTYHQVAKKQENWTPHIPFLVRTKRQHGDISSSVVTESVKSSIHNAPKKKTSNRPKYKRPKTPQTLHLGNVS